MLSTAKHLRLLCHSAGLSRALTCLDARGLVFHLHHASRSHTLYVDIIGDLHKRVFQHKWKEHDGFTAQHVDRDRAFVNQRHFQAASVLPA